MNIIFNPFTGDFSVFDNSAALAKSGGTMSGALSMGGNALSNFDSGHTNADVALGSDASTSVLAVTLTGLGNSKKYLARLGAQVWQYLDSDHSVGGAIDITIGLSISTDSSGVATVTLSGTVVPDVQYLPSGLAGATATVATSTGGFTLSATRKASSASHARAKFWIFNFEDVT